MGHEAFTLLAVEIVKRPDRVIEHAVYGMLPKSTLGRQALRKKLKVYAGASHPHQAQRPTPFELTRKK